MSNPQPVINRPFLKWAGGKAKLAARISAVLPKAQCLVEPFVGAGSIFLNTDYDHYILSDINPDLINTFAQLKQAPAASFFVPANNTDEQFRLLKARFNSTADQYEKALLFVYLNRFCFNGLCRYNQSGKFNVAFGKYKEPYFPKAEMAAFASRLDRAEVLCRSFEDVFTNLPSDCVVYCDPPYVPLTSTANFTSYSAGGFSPAQQHQLAKLAMACKAPVVLSNHNTPETQALYSGATLQCFDVQRNISQNGQNRGKAKELIASFFPQEQAA